MIKTNMAKALEIKKDQIRGERKTLLEALDVEMMIALGKGDTAKVAEIEAKKQALRDATKDKVLTKAKTPEELKAADPAAMKG